MSGRVIRPREAAGDAEPARLVHDRELGPLLSRANATYRAGLDETGAFQRLSQRLEKPERSWHWQGLTFGAVLSLAAGVVVVLGVFDDAPSRVAVGPEVSAGRRTPREESRMPEHVVGERRSAERDPASMGARAMPELPGPDAKPSSQDDERVSSEAAREQIVVPPLAAKPGPQRSDATERSRHDDARDDGSAHDVRARPDARVERKSTLPKPELAPSSVTSSNVEPKAESNDVTAKDGEAKVVTAKDGERKDDASAALGPAVAPFPVAPSSAARPVEARIDCTDLLQKDARAAEQCYAERAAESSGLSAEAALYELARLRRDVQRDPKGALAALNDYRERFPNGSLRNEVGLSRVELLSGLGRSREALSEAEALLASAQGNERAVELYLLRGDIYRRDLSDYAGAAREYAKAEAFGGGFGAEATRLRGLSLEALGDTEGALAAYRRYLSGPDQPRKTEVNRRIEALTASQRGKAP
ncbi:MAG TPA: hypothetical protein VMG12_28045 [Polyangiaceae bacterium]|nr:hypothetical protein [Polyangiaceae bacterium]